MSNRGMSEYAVFMKLYLIPWQVVYEKDSRKLFLARKLSGISIHTSPSIPEICAALEGIKKGWVQVK